MLFAAIAAVSVKLFVFTANGVAVTDYPSMERCEAAKVALIKAWRHEQDAAMPGYKIVKYGSFTALCIAG